MEPPVPELPSLSEKQGFSKRIETRVVFLSLLLGLATWMIDAILDFLYFYRNKGSFLDLLALDVPEHEIYIRSVILCFFILFGLVMSGVLAKRKMAERELQSAHDELERRVEERTEALRCNAERLKILQRIARAILRLRSPEEIARDALTGIRELLAFERASVSMFDVHARESRLVAVLSDRTTSLGAGTCFSLKPYEEIVNTLMQGKCYLVKDTRDVAHKWPVVQTLADEGIRSLIALPLSFRGTLTGALSVSANKPEAFTQEHIEVVREVSDLLAVAIQNARLYSSVHEQGLQLRALTSRLADAEECERRRLAQELHDRVGQNLSALTVNLSIVGDLMPEEVKANAACRIHDSLTLVDETMTCIRDVMADLRPPLLDDYGLPAALRWFADRFSMRTCVKSVLEIGELTSRLPASVEIALFRIVQEALTNVIRHAQARKVCLSLREMDGLTRMTIADDGVGFSPRAFWNPGEQQPGWGLMSMRERAEAVGGRLRVESAPSKGTQIVVELTRESHEHPCFPG